MKKKKMWKKMIVTLATATIALGGITYFSSEVPHLLASSQVRKDITKKINDNSMSDSSEIVSSSTTNHDDTSSEETLSSSSSTTSSSEEMEEATIETSSTSETLSSNIESSSSTSASSESSSSKETQFSTSISSEDTSISTTTSATIETESSTLPSSTNSENKTNGNNAVVGKEKNIVKIPKEEIEDNYNYSVVKNQTTEEFINSLKDDAQLIAWNNDLYASVMIAQAILETGSGNSILSSPPNYNLFGIKGSYKGSSVSMKTSEDDGSGNLYSINAGFKKYPSYKESLEDYAKLLKGGISGNSGFYKNTWKSNTNSYTDATAFLTGRYATDTYYNKKLNSLITTYKLTQYDGSPSEKPKSETSKEESRKVDKEIISKDNNKEDNQNINLMKRSASSTGLDEKTVNSTEEVKLGLMQRKIKDVSSWAKFMFTESEDTKQIKN